MQMDTRTRLAFAASGVALASEQRLGQLGPTHSLSLKSAWPAPRDACEEPQKARTKRPYRTDWLWTITEWSPRPARPSVCMKSLSYAWRRQQLAAQKLNMSVSMPIDLASRRRLRAIVVVGATNCWCVVVSEAAFGWVTRWRCC